jgi:hypothetical protein
MKLKHPLALLMFLCLTHLSFGQQDQSGILKTILATYYKTEKPVVKGRAQFVFLFCEKANNNEEMFETINELKLSRNETDMLKNRVKGNQSQANWASELEKIFSSGNDALKTKVNECMSLEAFQEKQKKTNFKNQRLLIISKPIFYTDGRTALVKVVFYRSIEHNSGSVLLMRKNGDNWEITSFLNPWET